MINVIILAGGKGKRVRPLSKFIPKALFPLGKKKVIDYIIEKIIRDLDIEKIYIYTIKEYEKSFLKWYKSKNSLYKNKIEFIIRKEKEKGAIDAMYYSIERVPKDKDIIFFCGDQYFEFNLREAYKFMKKVGSYVNIVVKANKEDIGEFGVVKLDENNKISFFLEKPKSIPKGELYISTGIYFIPSGKIKEFIYHLKNNRDKDNIGILIKHLVKLDKVYAFMSNKIWFDIGNWERYIKALEYIDHVEGR